MKISELAKRSGLTPDTLRFYEKVGLLDGDLFVRGENGYRQYDEKTLTRLELIKHGQSSGFTLGEIAQVIQAWEADEITPEQKIEYFSDKLRQIEERMQHLQQIHDYIHFKLANFQRDLEEMRQVAGAAG